MSTIDVVFAAVLVTTLIVTWRLWYFQGEPPPRLPPVPISCFLFLLLVHLFRFVQQLASNVDVASERDAGRCGSSYYLISPVPVPSLLPSFHFASLPPSGVQNHWVWWAFAQFCWLPQFYHCYIASVCFNWVVRKHSVARLQRAFRPSLVGIVLAVLLQTTLALSLNGWDTRTGESFMLAKTIAYIEYLGEGMSTLLRGHHV